MRSTWRRWVSALALGGAVSSAEPLWAADEPATTITRHAAAVAGGRLDYTAEAGRLPIRDVATGEPLGHVFYVAYRAQPAPGRVRPIMFIWNGGPGLPAASLHFEGAGPKRVEGGRLV
ncbi:MAG: hypothetical protein JSS35_06815, partial [Proteobacteria bacterium]|nr:hypothetical protein [Pseudomonadota bacterium]